MKGYNNVYIPIDKKKKKKINSGKPTCSEDDIKYEFIFITSRFALTSELTLKSTKVTLPDCHARSAAAT